MSSRPSPTKPVVLAALETALRGLAAGDFATQLELPGHGPAEQGLLAAFDACRQTMRNQAATAQAAHQQLDETVLELSQLFSCVAAGDFSVTAKRDESGDPLDVLGYLFNNTVAEIGSIFNRMRKLNAGLEGEVSLRTEELERALKAAESANRTKSDFLASMSHELRTPLNAIIGYAGLLIEEAEELGTPQALTDLQKIESAGRHLLRLIDDILDLSKVEAGRMELNIEEFELSALLAEVGSVVEALANKQAIELRMPQNLPRVRMRSDATKLRQNLLNLLSNACKFTHEGHVELKVVTAGPTIEFSVHDTGIGMTSEQLTQVFTGYVQAEHDTARRYGGTGLGLSITRSFCKLLQGDVTAESQPGKGSVFTMRLPLRMD